MHVLLLLIAVQVSPATVTEAKARYEKGIAKARAEYAQNLKTARADYLGVLKMLQRKALEAKDAKRVSELQKVLEDAKEGDTGDGHADLRKAITGTWWTSNSPNDNLGRTFYIGRGYCGHVVRGTVTKAGRRTAKSPRWVVVDSHMIRLVGGKEELHFTRDFKRMVIYYGQQGDFYSYRKAK